MEVELLPGDLRRLFGLLNEPLVFPKFILQHLRAGPVANCPSRAGRCGHPDSLGTVSDPAVVGNVVVHVWNVRSSRQLQRRHVSDLFLGFAVVRLVLGKTVHAGPGGNCKVQGVCNSYHFPDLFRRCSGQVDARLLVRPSAVRDLFC